MLPQAFKVLTEFKFEIGSALLNTGKLQDKVQDLQSTVDGVNASFQKMAIGMAFQNAGVASFAGVVLGAVNASEKFLNTQLAFSNIFASNADAFKGAETLTKQLQASERILDSMAKKGLEFGLSTNDMTSMTKSLAAILAPKGLMGDDAINAIELSRNILKTAPIMGLHPVDIEGQLLRAIEGSAGMGDTMFRRLMSETKAFADIRGTKDPSKRFNQLTAEDRFNKILKGFQQFASDPKLLALRQNTLGAQLQKLKNLINPNEFATTIFRPLGDVIRNALLDVLKPVIHIIETEGRQAAFLMSEFVKQFIKEPKKLALNLLTLRDISKNIDATKSTLNMLIIGQTVGWLLKLATGIKYFGGAAFSVFVMFGSIMAEFSDRVLPGLGKIVHGVGIAATFLAILIKFPAVLTAVGALFQQILLPIIALQGVFALFSRAAAFATLRDAETIPKLTVLFLKVANKWVAIFDTLTMGFRTAFDALAELISGFFRLTVVFETIGTVLNVIGTLFTYWISLMEAVGTAIGQLIYNIFNKDLMHMFSGVGDAFMDGWKESQARFAFNEKSLQGAVVKNNVNMHVTMENNFKENMQPDRIAFTVKEQLMKAATSRTQGRNGVFGVASRAFQDFAGANQ